MWTGRGGINELTTRLHDAIAARRRIARARIRALKPRGTWLAHAILGGNIKSNCSESTSQNDGQSVTYALGEAGRLLCADHLQCLVLSKIITAHCPPPLFNHF